MSINIERIDHIVLTVRDMEAAIAFYCDVLGMRLETFGEDRKALVFGSQKFNLHEVGTEIAPKENSPTPGDIDLCLITSTPVDMVLRTLLHAGVPIELGPVAKTGACGPILSIYIRDPDRNLIEIAQYDNAELNGAQVGRRGSESHLPALPAYIEFTAEELPDPRTSHYSEMIGSMVDIVKVEGPMTTRRLLDRYRTGAGLGKLRGSTREAITDALKYALMSKRIIKITTDEEDPSGNILSVEDLPLVRLRERGPRDLEDVPIEEIAELVGRLEIAADEEDETAFRMLLEAYGLKRLTETAKARLTRALRHARGVTV